MVLLYISIVYHAKNNDDSVTDRRCFSYEVSELEYTPPGSKAGPPGQTSPKSETLRIGLEHGYEKGWRRPNAVFPSAPKPKPFNI